MKSHRIVSYSDLLKHVKVKVSGGEVLFLPALNLLFLLGLIEYKSQTDAIEYIGPNNEII